MQLTVVIRPQRIDRGETRDAHARRAFMAKKFSVASSRLAADSDLPSWPL